MSTAVAKGVRSFACGQLVSLFSMASLVMAKYLAVRDVSTPAFLNCCFYILLALTCLSYSWRQQGKHPKSQPPLDSNSAGAEPTTPPGSPLTTPARMWSSSQLEDPEQEPQQSLTKPPQNQNGEQRWWVYPLVAFLDLQANCMAVRSLAFADYATVGLMLNLTIPFVSLLSCVVRGRKYTWRHALGCVLASCGSLVLFIDAYRRDQEGDESSQQLHGCFVALLAAFLYGASNVTNQVCLKAHGVDVVVESLGMTSAWASGLTMVQMLVLERAQVTLIEWTSDVSVCFAAYIAAMLAFYALVSLVPQTFASPMYNLSILASNLYLAIASVSLFGEAPRGFFFLALVLVLVGLTMHCIEHAIAESEAEALKLQDKPPHVIFKSMHTPSDMKLIAIQIEHAAL